MARTISLGDGGLGAIPRVSRTSLWNSWKTIRKDLRSASVRDVIDYLEYDVDPEKWISALTRQIASGRYEPSALVRFTLGKSTGFSRTMTLPSIPDLVLHRAIVDLLYRKGKRREHRHVYFRRTVLQKVQTQAQQAALAQIQAAATYRLSSTASFLNWLRYDQYRKHLVLDRIYPYLVVTDVSNFFDSVLHSHVEEAVRGLRVPTRMIGLLFFLLERLSIRQDYAGSHGISLPVDEFDCSRTLAHMVLFSYDDAIVKAAGEDAYVRWMDDQVMGVQSRADGLRLLGLVGRALGRLHLAPNAKKTRILSLSEARRHYHLDLNHILDRAESVARSNLPSGAKRRRVRKLTQQVWAKGRQYEEIGEFGKVLKRLYRLAGVAGARFLRRRALEDALSNPEIAERVCSYMRTSGSAVEYVNFVEKLMGSDEQVYASVNLAAVESLLRLEPTGYETRRLCTLAIRLLRGQLNIPGLDECRAVAPLLILRFGDRRSLSALQAMIDKEGSLLVTRAVGIVVASYGAAQFAAVRKAASKLLRNPLASIVLLIDRIREYDLVPPRYINRLSLHTDPVEGVKYVDMRSLLTVRLLALNRTPGVIAWLKAWKQQMAKANVSVYDQKLLAGLLP
jgi:hypothetical protein